MSPPLSFLAGLLFLLISDQIRDRLPGEESWSTLAMLAGVALVPLLVASTTARAVRRAVVAADVPGLWLRTALRLQPLSVPVCYAVLVVFGDLPTLATSASELASLQLCCLVGPLLAMEISLRLAERRAIRWLELVQRAPAQLGPHRLRMSLFVVAPILGVAAAADLLRLDRRLEVFVLETSLGSTLGLLAMGVVLCFALPLQFRFMMPLSPALPAAVAGDLRQTAEMLGFPGRAVLAMRTRYRLVNAALIGPLRWPRYLVLTDGLMALLDAEALRGVVAHEVGHAKANHPGILVLLFACLPALLVQPVLMADTSAIDGPTGWAVAAAGAVVAWFALRALFHRFEYEADQLSAEALGGAASCVRALRRVGSLAPHAGRRASFRHPSEASRIRNLERCEYDPTARRRFWRRGRLLRAGVVGALLAAAAVFAWSQRVLWPADRALYLFHTGRVQEAGDQLAQLDAVPATQQGLVDELRLEVDGALELGLQRSPWHELRGQLARRALPRLEDALAAGGPSAALPWISLAMYHRPAPAWLRSLERYCRAAAAEDQETAERVRRHILALEPPAPPAIRAALSL